MPLPVVPLGSAEILQTASAPQAPSGKIHDLLTGKQEITLFSSSCSLGNATPLGERHNGCVQPFSFDSREKGEPRYRRAHRGSPAAAYQLLFTPSSCPRRARYVSDSRQTPGQKKRRGIVRCAADFLGWSASDRGRPTRVYPAPAIMSTTQERTSPPLRSPKRHPSTYRF